MFYIQKCNFLTIRNLFVFYSTAIEYELEDKNLTKNEYLGLILLDLSLIPKYKSDEKEQVNFLKSF